MSSDFLKIKSLEGEYKLYHKKNDVGITVTTKELVYQRPHLTYHIRLEDIITIVPYVPGPGRRPFVLTNERADGTVRTPFAGSSDAYRLYVKEASVHNRSGIFHAAGIDFVLPLHPDLLSAVTQYAGLSPAAGDALA
ncbi:hypothetical protein J31TS4_09790 [Paenibacillus sp. J31TS4]|uniref:hypothetical protein n=1 Tax=Paenibacillus sp. J31TS4 TaxID=2807195 RepID=UPI001B24295F|nr:hypothetical protein [Paenibacillus sp. J31TS4]GIP37699.1 hypothetical protein J31TS4_09790 [Paenibacillus sp. J31TS4]